MIKFSIPRPWAVALAASFMLTYGTFTLIASSFQHAAIDAACMVQLPPVTVLGKRAAVVDDVAVQSIETTPAASKL